MAALNLPLRSPRPVRSLSRDTRRGRRADPTFSSSAPRSLPTPSLSSSTAPVPPSISPLGTGSPALTCTRGSQERRENKLSQRRRVLGCGYGRGERRGRQDREASGRRHVEHQAQLLSSLASTRNTAITDSSAGTSVREIAGPIASTGTRTGASVSTSTAVRLPERRPTPDAEASLQGGGDPFAGTPGLPPVRPTPVAGTLTLAEGEEEETFVWRAAPVPKTDAEAEALLQDLVEVCRCPYTLHTPVYTAFSISAPSLHPSTPLHAPPGHFTPLYAARTPLCTPVSLWCCLDLFTHAWANSCSWQQVRGRGCSRGGANVVAFSGGVDSSLTSFLVCHTLKPSTSHINPQSNKNYPSFLSRLDSRRSSPTQLVVHNTKHRNTFSTVLTNQTPSCTFPTNIRAFPT